MANEDVNQSPAVEPGGASLPNAAAPPNPAPEQEKPDATRGQSTVAQEDITIGGTESRAVEHPQPMATPATSGAAVATPATNSEKCNEQLEAGHSTDEPERTYREQGQCLAKYWIAQCIPGSRYSALVSDHTYKQRALGDFNLHPLIAEFAEVLGDRIAQSALEQSSPVSDAQRQFNQLAATYRNEYFSNCSENAEISAGCKQDIQQWLEVRFNRSQVVSVIKRFEVFICSWMKQQKDGLQTIEDAFAECSELVLSNLKGRQVVGAATKQRSVPAGKASGAEQKGNELQSNTEGPVAATAQSAKTNHGSRTKPQAVRAPPQAVERGGTGEKITRPSQASPLSKDSDILASRPGGVDTVVVTASQAANETILAEKASMVQAAWAEEKKGIEKDRSELESSNAQIRRWSERTTTFQNSAISVIEVSTRSLADSANILKELPPEIQDNVQSKQQGLTLTCKMLGRLSARLPKDIDIGAQELPVIGEARWQEMLHDVSDAKSAQERIKQQLADIAAQRYEVVTRMRDTVGKARKALLKFVEKDLLPVLDALDDGERLSGPAIADLKKGHVDAAEKLDVWFSTYGKLRSELMRVLSIIAVRPIEVNVGTPILYDRHEPFDVEPDPALPNEYIKAVVRNGYEFVGENGESTVLRPAQVVAVKNVAVEYSPPQDKATENPAPETKSK